MFQKCKAHVDSNLIDTELNMVLPSFILGSRLYEQSTGLAQLTLYCIHLWGHHSKTTITHWSYVSYCGIFISSLSRIARHFDVSQLCGVTEYYGFLWISSSGSVPYAICQMHVAYQWIFFLVFYPSCNEQCHLHVLYMQLNESYNESYLRWLKTWEHFQYPKSCTLLPFAIFFFLDK